MGRDKKLSNSINDAVNLIIARFITAVFIVIIIVTILSYTGIFETTLEQMYFLLLAGAPGGLFGCLALARKFFKDTIVSRNILCIVMCLQAFAVAMAAYSYAGTVILLLPVLLSALYPKSKISLYVSLTMLLFGIIVPPLALASGFWDGGYYEFLYDLTNGRQMDTATLSNVLLTREEQIISAVRYCSSQNLLIIGGFIIIGRLIYNQTNISFDNRLDIARLSETDGLTGLLNRSCFERVIEELSYFGTKNTVCFYFDVNGLHELNGDKGHKAGDIMLKFVGEKIQEAFGEDNSFRVGGDEYVAFARDMDPASLPEVKASLEKAFASEGYHVAVGYAQSNITVNINNLVQQAEKEMYHSKEDYYSALGTHRTVR